MMKCYSKKLMTKGNPSLVDQLKYRKFTDEVFVVSKYVADCFEKKIECWNNSSNEKIKLDKIILKNKKGEVVIEKDWKKFLVELIYKTALDTIEIRNDPDALFSKTISDFYNDKDTIYTLWEKQCFKDVYKQIKITAILAAKKFETCISIMEKQRKTKTGLSRVSSKSEKLRENYISSFRGINYDVSFLNKINYWSLYLAVIIDIAFPKIIETST